MKFNGNRSKGSGNMSVHESVTDRSTNGLTDEGHSHNPPFPRQGIKQEFIAIQTSKF